MSGLSCAGVPPKWGKVLVLEQHDRCGGGSHTYELGPGYTFDAGLHYTVPWSGPMITFACGHESRGQFDNMGQDTEDGGFDRVVLGADPEFRLQHGEKHVARLYEMFPKDKAQIDEVCSLEDSCAAFAPCPHAIRPRSVLLRRCGHLPSSTVGAPIQFIRISDILLWSTVPLILSKCFPIGVQSDLEVDDGPVLSLRWPARARGYARDMPEQTDSLALVRALVDTGARPDTGTFYLMAASRARAARTAAARTPCPRPSCNR